MTTRRRKGITVVAAILVALAGMAGAHAGTVVHRSAVAAGEASATGGSFSVRFPVVFDDIEVRADAPTAPTAIVRLLTGKTPEGLRFSTTEMTSEPATAVPPNAVDGFVENVKKRPGAVVSDMRRDRRDDTETLSFSLAEPTGGSYFRMVRATHALYMQVIQFPEAQRDKAATMKDDFFTSFTITRQ